MYTVEARREECHEEGIWTVDWCRSEEAEGKIVTGALDNTIKLWEYRNEKLSLEKILVDCSLPVVSVAVAPNGKVFASSSLDYQVLIWDLETYELVQKIKSPPVESWSVQFTRGSSHLLSRHADGKVKMFHVTTGEEVMTVKTMLKGTVSMASSADGKWIACGNICGYISLVHGETGENSKKFEAHDLAIRALAFSPDSKHFLSGSDDTLIQLRTVSDGKVVSTFSGHSRLIRSLVFSPDGRKFASSSVDKTVRIWDLARPPYPLYVFDDVHSNEGVFSIAWGSNDKLCSVGDDRSINIYSIPNFQVTPSVP